MEAADSAAPANTDQLCQKYLVMAWQEIINTHYCVSEDLYQQSQLQPSCFDAKHIGDNNVGFAIHSNEMLADGLSLWTRRAAQSANAFLHAGAPMISITHSALRKHSPSILAAFFLAAIIPGVANALPGEFTLNQPTAMCKGHNPEIHLSWGASLNATQYGVYRNGMVYEPNVHFLTFDNADHVVPDKTYTYFIRASDPTGTTDSNPVTVTAPDCTTSATEEGKADPKLNERICLESGYIRLSNEFIKCIKDPMAVGARAKVSHDEVAGELFDVAGDVKAASNCLMEQTVSPGTLLEKSMVISTGEKSHAVLQFEDGHLIALQANTIFKINNYRFHPETHEDNNMVFSMLKGGLRSITGLLGKIRPDVFKLQTPSATIGIRGTDFMVVMAEKDEKTEKTDKIEANKTYLYVTSGAIELTNTAGKVKLGAGEAAVVASAATPAVSVSIKTLPPETFSQLKAIDVPAPEMLMHLNPDKMNSLSQEGAGWQKKKGPTTCKDMGFEGEGNQKLCQEYIDLYAGKEKKDFMSFPRRSAPSHRKK